MNTSWITDISYFKSIIIMTEPSKVLYNQILSLLANIHSWFYSFFPKYKAIQRAKFADRKAGQSYCIQIDGAGGIEQLNMVPLNNRVTVGYNIPGFLSPFANLPDDLQNLPADLLIISVKHFSVNYADICIRWGLYESALRYVGWPIVPGFDFSGVVEFAHPLSGFHAGDHVFGFTLFGSYSTRLLVPQSQVRKLPTLPSRMLSSSLSPLALMSSVPAVAATALHALSLASIWPTPLRSRNKAVLIHSAAGGVGSMLLQMCRLLGCHPIVAVVGSKHKTSICMQLGAHHVIDKSSTDLWKQAEQFSPDGFAAIFDANGVETLSSSYNHLARCGHLVIYGFHTNIPKATSWLSPLSWMRMIAGMIRMPHFDPMCLVTDSRTVAGFNLSFFAEEAEIIDAYMQQIIAWIEADKLDFPPVEAYAFHDVDKAQEAIQTGLSIGKIIVNCD